MDISPKTHIRDVRKALGLPASKCRYFGSVSSIAGTINHSWEPGSGASHVRACPAHEVLVSYRHDDYQRMYFQFVRKNNNPAFAPKLLRISIYMPDGKLARVDVSREPKTHLHIDAVKDAMTTLFLKWRVMEKKQGNRLPAWLR